MVKKVLIILASALLLAVAALLAGGWWLLATPQGQRWLLAEFSRQAAVTIEAGRVEGRLLDHLRLEGVNVSWTGGKAHVDTVELRWRPAALLRGELAIDELSLDGGLVTWSAPPPDAPAAASFTWPDLNGWPLRLRASIAVLRLTNLEMLPPEGEPQCLDRLNARLVWRGGVISATELDAVMAGYRLHGTAAAGFRQPQLRLDLQIGLPAMTAGVDGVALHADLAPAAGVIMAGPFALQGESRNAAVLQLHGELAVSSGELALRGFELTRSDRSGVLRGTAELVLAEVGAAHWRLQGSLAELDLKAETGLATALRGSIEVTGSGPAYRGHFELVNSTEGWAAARLAGPISGDADGIDLPQLQGSWLGGQLAGALRLSWAAGFSLAGKLRGRQLDPAAMIPAWPGLVNFDLAGEYARPVTGQPRASLQGRLRESTLRGLALTGRIDADLAGDDLRIAALELHGDGFALNGHGRLAERFELRATISRLASLVPAAQGALTAQGWLRWRDGVLAGAIDGHGRQLTYDDLQITALRLVARLPGGTTPATAEFTASGLAYREWQLRQLAVQFAGRLPEHSLELLARWPEGEIQVAATGGWRNDVWAGTVTRCDGRDRVVGPWRLLGPMGLEAGTERIRITALRLAGVDGESLQLDGSLAWQPGQGDIRAQWQNLDLARCNPWLAATHLAGRSSGSVSLQWRPDGSLDLAGRLETAGEVRHQGQQLVVGMATSEFAWGNDGLNASLTAELEEGGRAMLRLSSAQPGHLALPEYGHFAAEWNGLNLTRLRPWLPKELELAGELRGSADGGWQAGWQLEMAGAVEIDAGRLSWQTETGEVGADLRAAGLHWEWRDEGLSGGLELALAEQGNARGSFRLPLPARLPAAMNPDGPLHLDLKAQAAERGLLNSFFPGLIEASRGELEVQAQARGTWQNPALGGSIRLTGAGAYFPAAGIELEEVSLDAALAGDEVRLTSLRARSGNGQISGSGSIRLKDWWPAAYHGTLSGDDFTVVHLPELRLLISPDLTIEGTGEHLQLRGEIRIPELTLLDREQPGVVRESPDVIIVETKTQADQASTLALDMRVQIKLGERVLVKIAGFDARLSGGVELQVTRPGEVAASGEIQVAEGVYSTYGVQLRIERGRLLYAGGPIDQPTLDIQALRTIGEVKAGVQVAGTPRKPVIKLYSEPAMADTDILAYIVLGHPLGAETGQLSLLSAAAGALLSQGQSATLQDQIKRQLGIDVIEIERGGEGTDTMVSIGKYLNPKLYLSLGQALFTNASEARLRYSITPRWELESRTSAEASGVDLYYKLEFD